MHVFQPSVVPPDYYGRRYCNVCQLPGETDDARHRPAQDELRFTSFTEASQPPEREEAIR